MSERLLAQNGAEWATKYRDHFPRIGPLRGEYRIPYLQMAYDEEVAGKPERHWEFEIQQRRWHLQSRIHTLPSPADSARVTHRKIKSQMQRRQDMHQHFNGMRKAETTHAACINLIWSNIDAVCDSFFPVPQQARPQQKRNYGYIEVGMHLRAEDGAKYLTPDVVIE